MAVLVLVVAAFDLGKRLWVSVRPPDKAEGAALSIPRDVKLNLEQLGDQKPKGYAWDGPGTVRFMDRVYVSLGRVVHPETLTVSLDGNDSYLLSLMADDENVGFLEVEPTWVGGLEVYKLTIPEEATSHGFDSIVIEVGVGDNAYAIGHLLLDPINDEDPTALEGPG